MHLLLKKRHLILAGLIVVLSLAVFVNWYYTGTDIELNPEGTAANESTDTSAVGSVVSVNAEIAETFAGIRLAKNAERDETMEELREAAATAPEGSDTFVAVSAAMESLSRIKQCESDIESLVSAGLGGECVAVLSDNTVDVVVSQELLTDEGVLKINDIVATVCPTGYENVRISSPQ